MVVGPPGTGKTDVAVQIISNLYHNHPTQKILLVTHSNAALNDLFEKIMEVGKAERRNRLKYRVSLSVEVYTLNGSLARLLAKDRILIM
jgi:superfamily I DNA/RNA helicase